MTAIVVKAKFDETLDTGESWIVKKGDLGVLQWSSHKRHPRFLEAPSDLGSRSFTKGSEDHPVIDRNRWPSNSGPFVYY